MKKIVLPTCSLLFLSLLISACGSGKITKPHGSGWTFELLASGREVGIHSSLATTSDGTVFIAFHDLRAHDLHLARRLSAGEWTTTAIDTVGWVGESVTILIDQNDDLHLAYQDSWNRGMRYAFQDASGWTYEHFNPFEAKGEAPVMIEQPDGIHMVELYTAARTGSHSGEVNYWRKAAGGWEQLSSFSLAYMRPFIGFTIGPDGPVIALILKDYDGTAVTSAFSVVRQSAADGAGPWTREYIVDIESYESLNYGDRPIGVEFDTDGVSHLIYLGRDNILIDTGIGNIDTSVRNSQVVLRKGPGGGLWLTYVKGTTMHLSRYTTAAGWERMGRIGDIDPEGRYDMRVDADGVIHLSVYHGPDQRLWYGRWEGTP